MRSTVTISIVIETSGNKEYRIVTGDLRSAKRLLEKIKSENDKGVFGSDKLNEIVELFNDYKRDNFYLRTILTVGLVAAGLLFLFYK